MNIDCRAEIARIMSRTSPVPALSPLMILAKWVYLDAARVADVTGNPAAGDAIRKRAAEHRSITNVPDAIAKLPQEAA